MRLWSIHPCYLDAKGLVALWREALLAQKVLQGKTKGYKNHPQLSRFKNTKCPEGALADYLACVADEADRRNYNFNREKIGQRSPGEKVFVKEGQLQYEFRHLLGKLKQRAPDLYEKFRNKKEIKIHPMFIRTSGGVEAWEITS